MFSSNKFNQKSCFTKKLLKKGELFRALSDFEELLVLGEMKGLTYVHY